MILLDGSGLSVRRPDRALFEDFDLTVHSGDRLGFVGVNGTGKSTLLGVLAGSRPAEAGTVRRGRTTRISHLDQDAPLPTGTVGSVTGDRWQAAAVRDRLGLSGLEDRPTDALSGGQIKRVALARALLAVGPPEGGPADADDLLILDEPTNHLDVVAIAWLEEWLSDFRGALLLVTHDRHVLDRVTTRIVELDRGAAYVHEGGYASYLDGRSERAERAEVAETKRRNLARAELAWLRRGAPARTSKPKARLDAAAAIVEGAPASADVRDQALDLHLGTPRLGDKVIELHGVGAEVGGRVLFDGLDLLLDRRERLGIVGANGAGKSTLLRILSGERAPDHGTVDVGPTVRIAAFSQDAAELDGTRRVRDVVTGGAREVSWHDRALMERFWFDGDAQWAPVDTLSGGERRRLQLLLALQSEPNVLLLDEPTNDLDLDTLRVVEDFLDDWPGALVVVSHDRALLERTVTDVLVIDGERAERRSGGLAAYLSSVVEGRRRGKASLDTPDPAGTSSADAAGRSGGGGAGPGSAAPGASGSAATASAADAPSARSSQVVRKELNRAERDLARAAEAVEAIEAALADALDDHARLAELGRDLNAARAVETEAEERWLALAEEAEATNPGLFG